MTFTLRPYQQELVATTVDLMRSGRIPALVLPTCAVISPSARSTILLADLSAMESGLTESTPGTHAWCR